MPQGIIGGEQDPPTERVCAVCGNWYPASANFCPRDGQTLVSDSADESGLIGQVVAERYLVERRLGLGGMGVVYLARQVFMDRPCALKVLRPEYLGRTDALARFARGAQNAARIEHRNVATVYDFGEIEGEAMFLAMEYVDGHTLTAALRHGPLSFARVCTIAVQVASALRAAHELGIVHRDLKPDNIMLARSGDTNDLVKVVDFGIARAIIDASQQMTAADAIVGTPAFMSPEQISGDQVDARSDLYSFGLVVCLMLAGRLPFGTDRGDVATRFLKEPRRLRELRPETDWPTALEDAVSRALAPDREQRQATVTQFVREMMDAARAWRPSDVGEAIAALARLGADVSLAMPVDAAVRLQTPLPQKPVTRTARQRMLAGVLLALTGTAAAASFIMNGARGDPTSHAREADSPSIAPPPSESPARDSIPSGAGNDTIRPRDTPTAVPQQPRPQQTRAASVEPSARATAAAALEPPPNPLPLPRSLTDSAPPRPTRGIVLVGAPRALGAFLLVNERLIGVVAGLRALDLPAGQSRLTLRLDRCQDWDTLVTVIAGDTTTVGLRTPVC